jgi:hypothetical protein
MLKQIPVAEHAQICILCKNVLLLLLLLLHDDDDDDDDDDTGILQLKISSLKLIQITEIKTKY